MQVEGCAITLTSPTHLIAISVKKGKFRVYDPSHNKLDICDDAQALVKLLGENIFPQNGQAATLLPLTMNVYSHPEKIRAAVFPKKALIIKNIKNINQYVTTNGINFDSLAMAAMQNDVEQIKLLFANAAQNPDVALQLAARDNRLEALKLLLEPAYRVNIKKPAETMVRACVLAVEFGRIDALDTLLTDVEIDASFQQHLAQHVNQENLLKKVSASGSFECITRLLDYYESNFPDINIPALIKDTEAVNIALKTGNQHCVKKLAERSGARYLIPLQKNSPILLSKPIFL